MDKIISCYSTRALLKYAKSKGMDITDLLVKVDEIAYVLLESEHWTTLEVWTQIITFISKRLNKSIFDIGYELVKKEKDLDYRLGLIVLIPFPIIKKINLLNSIVQKKVNRNLTAKIISFDEIKHEMCLWVAPLNMEEHRKGICEYNKGVCKALMELKGYIGIQIEELECCFNGKPHCSLRVIWEGRNKLFEKQVFDKLMRKLKSFKIDTIFGNIKSFLMGV